MDDMHDAHAAAVPDSGASQHDDGTRITRGNVTVIRDAQNPDMVTIRTRKRKKRRRGKRKGWASWSMGRRVAVVAVAAVLALAAAAGIAAAALVSIGNASLHLDPVPLDATPEDVKVADAGDMLDYQGHHYVYNKDVVSVMFIGHDDESAFVERAGANCADANVLVAVDTETKKVRAIMIPRNSYVYVDVYQGNVFTETQRMNLTLSYAVDVQTEEQRAENTTKAVSRIFFGIPLKYYVAMDEAAIADASTAVGGVELEALSAIPGAEYGPGDTVMLMGQDAFRYVQYRDVNVFESALDRQQRQVQFVKAFMKKAAANGAKGLVDLYQSVAGEITTNLGASEVSYLASVYASGHNGNLEIVQLTGETKEWADDDGVVHEHYYLDKDSIVKTMLDTFYVRVD